jgi:tellurite resistance protein
VPDPFPTASASIEIDKPVDLVRAQFFDLDHAIRGKIHHGVALRWLPPEAPGERRVQQEVKLMARSHVDVFVVEEGEGGAWIKRLVDGPNKGTALEASFEPLGPQRTRVRFRAFVGPGGYFGALGKLSQLGLEKALQKTLEEHRRALEGYQPGRARGAVRAVLAPMRDAVLAAPAAAGRIKAVMSNLLEAACVTAISDGQADEAEREVIQHVGRELCFTELDAPSIERMVNNVLAAAHTDGLEVRCDKIAARLKALGLGEVGLGVAVLVAEVSHGIDAPELAVLRRLAWGLGVEEGALSEMVYRIDRELMGERAGG